MEAVAALNLPANPAGWTRYWTKLTRPEQILVIKAGLATRDGLPNARKGWNEFTHALWMVFADVETKTSLKNLGLTDAADDRGIVQSDHRLETDPADSELACFDSPEYCEPEEVDLIERFGISLELARKIRGHYDNVMAKRVEARAGDMVRQVVGAVLCEPNLKVATFALATVFGIPTGFKTQTEFAKTIAVAKATVSKKVVELRRSLGVRVNAWGKSDAACATFSEAQKKNHWRRRKNTVPDAAFPSPA